MQKIYEYYKFNIYECCIFVVEIRRYKQCKETECQSNNIEI